MIPPNLTSRAYSSTNIRPSSGSIIALDQPRRTCRRWRLQVSLGVYDPIKECYPRKTRRFDGTITEAKRALRDFIEEIEEGANWVKPNILFPDLAEIWLSERKGNVSNATIKKNSRQIRNLNIYLSSTLVKDLDLSVVRNLLSALKTKGGVAGKPFSGTTCQGIFATLSLILDFAKYKGLLQENPCKLLDRAMRPKSDTKEKKALSPDQIKTLMNAIREGEPTGKKMGLLLALCCGLCREEFLAVQWHDIDFEQKCIRIDSANTCTDKELVKTKNAYRSRILPIEDAELELLAEWKDLQAEILERKGITATEQTPVVSNPVGEFMHPEAYAKWWRRFRKPLGLEEFGLHQLRHTFATILCASGIDIITASKLMGHKDATMLALVYAHMVPENARKATSTVSNILNGVQTPTYMPFA